MSIENEKARAQFIKNEQAGEESEKAGHRVERAVLGEINTEGYQRFVEKKLEEFGGKKPSEEVMFQIYRDAVKENQKTFKNPSDPRAPGREPFASDLHSTVVEMLGKKIGKDMEYDQLRYYSAVGSDLDRKYGTDAFLELDLGEGKTIDVTLDITLKPEHAALDKYKADVFMMEWERIPLELSDFDRDSSEALRQKKENRDRYQKRTEEVADKVVLAFQGKADKANMPILALEKDEILKSRDEGYERYEREVGWAKKGMGIRRNLEMMRSKRRPR